MRLILACLTLLWSVQAFAYIEPANKRPGAKGNNDISFRSDCAPATMSYDLAINNVRARLLNGGDVWWDLSDGQYIVPKVDPALGVPGVSSLFAGAVWLKFEYSSQVYPARNGELVRIQQSPLV